MQLVKKSYVNMHQFAANMDYRKGLAGIVPLDGLIASAKDEQLAKSYATLTKGTGAINPAEQQAKTQCWLDAVFGKDVVMLVPNTDPQTVSVSIPEMEKVVRKGSAVVDATAAVQLGRFE